MVDALVSVVEMGMVVVSEGFWVSEVLSGVLRVSKDVDKAISAVVPEVLHSMTGVVVDGEANFVILMVSAGNCVMPLEVTVGVVVFSVGVTASETLAVSVIEVMGDDTFTVGEVASVGPMLVDTGRTGKVLILVGSELEVDGRTGLELGGEGIVVVRVSSVEDSVGLLVVEVTETGAEIDTGLVYNVVEEMGLDVMLGVLMVLSVEARGLQEEEDVVNVVMISTTSGLIGEVVGFSVVGMCTEGVVVVLDSDTVVEMSVVETAGMLEV